MIEYRLIQEHYGDRRAERSGQLLMDHIDDGLAVLGAIGASDSAKRAFCLHPIFQADADLAKVCQHEGLMSEAFMDVDRYALLLVMEYRNQANAWLSTKVQVYPTDPHQPLMVHGAPSPGPLLEVKHMLIADKVQNYKDFLAYHKDTHPRARELERYFQLWLVFLEVFNFQALCDVIDQSKRAR